MGVIKQEKERLLILSIERKKCLEATCYTATTIKKHSSHGVLKEKYV